MGEERHMRTDGHPNEQELSLRMARASRSYDTPTGSQAPPCDVPNGEA